MRMLLVVCAALGAGTGSVVGCGGGGGGGGTTGDPLDCAWLASNNCWKATANMATSCLPPSTESGVLSADNRTCIYASGVVVTFAPPLVLPLPDDPPWNFTVTGAGGQTCLHYEKAASSAFTLVVGDQTFAESLLGITGLRVTCPDGSIYSNENAFDLFSCPGTVSLPGNAWSSSDTDTSFALIGTSSSSSQALSVFNCQKP